MMYAVFSKAMVVESGGGGVGRGYTVSTEGPLRAEIENDGDRSLSRILFGCFMKIYCRDIVFLA